MIYLTMTSFYLIRYLSIVIFYKLIELFEKIYNNSKYILQTETHNE